MLFTDKTGGTRTICPANESRRFRSISIIGRSTKMTARRNCRKMTRRRRFRERINDENNKGECTKDGYGRCRRAERNDVSTRLEEVGQNMRERKRQGVNGGSIMTEPSPNSPGSCVPLSPRIFVRQKGDDGRKTVSRKHGEKERPTGNGRRR